MKDSAYTRRRDFLKGTASAAAAFGAIAHAQTSRGKTAAIVIDPSDRDAASPPVQWAAQELAQTLTRAGIDVQRHERPEQAAGAAFVVMAAARRVPSADAAEMIG